VAAAERRIIFLKSAATLFVLFPFRNAGFRVCSPLARCVLAGQSLAALGWRAAPAAPREPTKLSIKRLNAEEKAAYLLGLAVMRQLKNGTPDPDSIHELNAVLRWAEHWLTGDELEVIGQATGLLFDDDLADLLEADARALRQPRDDGGSDDIPF
jgi:hypothetical protein